MGERCDDDHRAGDRPRAGLRKFPLDNTGHGDGRRSGQWQHQSCRSIRAAGGDESTQRGRCVLAICHYRTAFGGKVEEVNTDWVEKLSLAEGSFTSACSRRLGCS
jgi:hypothetical protein